MYCHSSPKSLDQTEVNLLQINAEPICFHSFSVSMHFKRDGNLPENSVGSAMSKFSMTSDEHLGVNWGFLTTSPHSVSALHHRQTPLWGLISPASHVQQITILVILTAFNGGRAGDTCARCKYTCETFPKDVLAFRAAYHRTICTSSL